MAVSDAALAILDGLAKKKLEDVKDPKVREFLTNVWGGLKDEVPNIFDVLMGPTETVLTGKYAEKTKHILANLQDDVLAFKRKEISEAGFKELVWRRKRAIFALYQAQKATDAQIKADQILSAAATIGEILVKYGIPFILAII